MINEIKAYWDKQKKEYEDRYKETFLKDYERSKEYIKKMESYLLSKQKEYPSDIDIVCTLASLKLELRRGEYIRYLNSFFNKFEIYLDNAQKARVYTNIAFNHDYTEETLEYLLKAKDLDSPFVETYTGLGLYYFSMYQSNEDKEWLILSQKYFEKAKNIDDSYEYAFNHAVSLYELKKYENAKMAENIPIGYRPVQNISLILHANVSANVVGTGVLHINTAGDLALTSSYTTDAVWLGTVTYVTDNPWPN